MIQRCENPHHVSYPRYGGRGITVCARWRASFADFLADVGRRPSPRHTLDREDNDAGYAPENCRWASPLQQGRNKSNNRVLTFGGLHLTVSEWCRRLDIPKSTILNRLSYGWPVERVLQEATP